MFITGLQIILQHNWNIFNDPNSSIAFIFTMVFCRVFHKVTTTIGNYLEIWFVPQSEVDFSLLRGIQSVKGLDEELAGIEEEEKVVTMRPPAWSVLHDWKPPMANDIIGMDRYRSAFIQENQLWLQHVFKELLDEETQLRYRRTLLKSLTRILEEVEPQYYSPFGLPPKIMGGEIVPVEAAPPGALESGLQRVV